MPTTITARRKQLALLFGAALVTFVAALVVWNAVDAPPAHAITQTNTIRDNSFSPETIRIDPGDSVIWRHTGRNVHNIVADDGSFRSGDMRNGQTFDKRFPDAGYFRYYCRYHGARGGRGMSGVIVVGDVEEPVGNGGNKPDRDRVVVPSKKAKTIQKGVDTVKPGGLVTIKPGVYHEDVIVTTPGITIKGVDRFRTVLDGQDEDSNGFLIDRVDGVAVKNLTVRNYLQNGIFYYYADRYLVDRVDAIKGRTYGIYAFNSLNGVIKNSFGWGSGDSAFYIGQCFNCGALIDNVVSRYNYLGYSGTNATGVVIRNSTFSNNGVGIAPNTLPTEEFAPNRGTLMINNTVVNNNYSKVPPAGISESFGVPFGTGIWLVGVHNNVARDNVITNHNSYGVLVTQSIQQDSFPMRNVVENNTISNFDADDDGYGYALAYDGTGGYNCFAGNQFEGETGPPDIETLYPCSDPPPTGVPYGPVQAHVAESLSASQTREWEEPPEPKRPKCQKGAPGCKR